MLGFQILKLLPLLFCIFNQKFISALLKDNLKQTEIENKLLKKNYYMQILINDSVDPCDNFYNFACGHWASLKPISNNSDQQQFNNYFTELQETYRAKVIEILSKNLNETQNEYLRKIQIFYQSCLNYEIEPTEILKILTKFGGMPVVEGPTWDADSFDWIETLALIQREYGFEILISLTISTDLNDNHLNRLYIDSGKFDLETKSMYFDPKHDTYRKAQLSKIAMELRKNLGLNKEPAVETATQIFKLEQQFAVGLLDEKIYYGLEQVYKNTTIWNLQQKYAPTIDFVKFVNVSLREVPRERIYVGWPTYFSNLAQTVNTIEKSVLANYIFYHLIKNFILNTKGNMKKRKSICIKKVEEYFAHEIDTLMYEQIRDVKKEIEIFQLFESLKKQFQKKLRFSTKFNWFSNATRQAAIKKLEALKFKINIWNETEIAKSLENLNVTENAYINNLKNTFKQKAKNYHETLHLPPHFEGGSHFSPAMFLPGNIITMPVSYLQAFFVWDSTYPAAVKYGVVGFLLAHEIIHAFDNTGRQFDIHGNLQSWWDDLSAKNFLKLRDCFKLQYQEYIYGGAPLPRNENQDENIADNGGIQMAFEAYKKFAQSYNNDLESLKYFKTKDDELFFLSFAQFFCGTEMDSLKNRNAEDEHTPIEFRVIGVLSNLEAFADVYNCPLGSKMNPKNKCLMY